MIRKVNKTGLWKLVSVLVLMPSVGAAFGEMWQPPKDFKVSDHFVCYGSGNISWDWRALDDPNNNPILVACLAGATDESLRALGVADLPQRLEKLQRANLVRKTEHGYTFAFPAVIGEKRARLQEYVEQASKPLLPFAERMVADIRPHLAGREEMLYHVLWSDIMDASFAWDIARAAMTRQVPSGDTSSDNKGWVIYPPHPSDVGTNTYNTMTGNLCITWSRNTPSPNAICDAVSQHEVELVDAVEKNGVVTSKAAKDALGKYGLVDDTGRVRLYTVAADSEAAKAYVELGRQFGQEIMNHLDVTKVADMLGVAPGVAFLIAYHEVCWQLLHDLAPKGSLPVPELVARAGADLSKTRELVTLAIVPKASYPFLETAMSEQEKAAIKRFNEVKSKILAGEKYFNLSTPVDALLSLISATVSKDADSYRKTNPGTDSAPEFDQGWIDDYKQMCIYRVEPWSKTPAEGDVHPIYVADEGKKEFSDTEVFIYRGARWQKLFNNGNSRTDWRQGVDWAKSLLKQQKIHESEKKL